MKVYISGAISGRPFAEAKAEFADAARMLRYRGHEPVDPFEVEPCVFTACAGEVPEAYGPDGAALHTWQCYMKHDIAELVFCEMVLALPNWADSRGATIEVNLAKSLDIPVYEYDGVKGKISGLS